jgi:hypothetical protein
METLDLDFNLGFIELHSIKPLFEETSVPDRLITDKGHLFYYSICDVPDCDSGADISEKTRTRSAYMTLITSIAASATKPA